jgi:hypothetical protein
MHASAVALMKVPCPELELTRYRRYKCHPRPPVKVLVLLVGQLPGDTRDEVGQL